MRFFSKNKGKNSAAGKNLENFYTILWKSKGKKRRKPEKYRKLSFFINLRKNFQLFPCNFKFFSQNLWPLAPIL